MVKPLNLRKLRAEMEMKELDLKTVARRARVPYTTTSEILNNRRNDPLRLSRISAAISSFPMPEVHA